MEELGLSSKPAASLAYNPVYEAAEALARSGLLTEEHKQSCTLS